MQKMNLQAQEILRDVQNSEDPHDYFFVAYEYRESRRYYLSKAGGLTEDMSQAYLMTHSDAQLLRSRLERPDTFIKGVLGVKSNPIEADHNCTRDMDAAICAIFCDSHPDCMVLRMPNIFCTPLYKGVDENCRRFDPEHRLMTMWGGYLPAFFSSIACLETQTQSARWHWMWILFKPQNQEQVQELLVAVQRVNVAVCGGASVKPFSPYLSDVLRMDGIYLTRGNGNMPVEFVPSGEVSPADIPVVESPMLVEKEKRLQQVYLIPGDPSGERFRSEGVKADIMRFEQACSSLQRLDIEGPFKGKDMYLNLIHVGTNLGVLQTFEHCDYEQLCDCTDYSRASSALVVLWHTCLAALRLLYLCAGCEEVEPVVPDLLPELYPYTSGVPALKMVAHVVGLPQLGIPDEQAQGISFLVGLLYAMAQRDYFRVVSVDIALSIPTFKTAILELCEIVRRYIQ